MHLMTQPPIGSPQENTGTDPRDYYKHGKRAFAFPQYQIFHHEEELQGPIDLDSLELVSDDALFEDWKLRPVGDGSFAPPGHLNPDFDFEFEENRILEGDFYEARRRERPIFQQIRNQILVARNPPEPRDALDDEPQRQDDQFHRWYRTMPLVWEALSLQPIGHQVELGGVRGLFRMQGCRLRLTIRSAQEEDALRRILEILGYRHARYRDLNQVYVRRDFPIADPRQALRELMQPMTEEFGFANIDDYVLRFIEVGRPPDRMPDVDARLNANMVDFY
jgi:hypothetical protein